MPETASTEADSTQNGPMNPAGTAQIGVFGGSGFYQFLESVREFRAETPYGPPSDRIALAEVGGKRIAFLPRHGKDHSHPAHMVNYRANVYAMHSLGVRQILAPCACGSLQADIHPGDFVLLDQFVDRTRGRKDTYFDGPITHHISAAEPYCPRLREVVRETAEEQGIKLHPAGTMVVIQGPRFSARAESEFYTKMGWHVVGMTQYPEAILAKELGVCYAGIALVTDYDAGVAGDIHRPPVNIEDVLKVMQDNNERVRRLILRIAERLGPERSCECQAEAERAVLSRD
jgi:5'-methylthioadenosine phosphorylase